MVVLSISLRGCRTTPTFLYAYALASLLSAFFMKHIIISTILSVIYPGIGQIYNGQRVKGILLILLELILGYFEAGNTYLLFAFSLVWIYGVIDALWTAIQMNRGNREPRFLTGRRAVIEVGISLVVIVPLVLISSSTSSEGLVVKMDQEPPEDLAVVQKEAQAYLEEKYGEQFGIKDSDYVYEIGEYNFTAFPKKNPEVTFAVYRKGSQPFKDTYFMSYWSKQSREALRPVMDEFFPDAWIFHSDFGVKEEVKKKVLLQEEIPDYEEVVDQFRGQYTQHVNISVIKDITGPEQEELERILKLIQHLQEKKVDKVTIEVSYYAESLPEKARQDKDKLGNYYEHLKYSFRLRPQDLHTIETTDDIEERFRKLND